MIKTILPFEKLIYRSNLTKEELLAHLQNEIEAEKSFGFGANNFSYSKPYIGKIYNDDWMRERGFLDSEIKVKDLISAKKDKAFYSVQSVEKIRNVLKIMKERDISQLPVLENENIIGTVSENSILSFILENPLDNADKEVKLIMSDPMPKVSMDLPLSLLNKCFSEKIPGVITKDQNDHYHVLTKYDVIRAL